MRPRGDACACHECRGVRARAILSHARRSTGNAFRDDRMNVPDIVDGGNTHGACAAVSSRLPVNRLVLGASVCLPAGAYG